MFRHGLRVSEACSLRLSQVDVESRVLHVTRLKKALATTHPLPRRRAEGGNGMVFRTRPDEAGGRFPVRQRTATAVEPENLLSCESYLWRAGRTPDGSSPAPAEARLRLRTGRPGSRYQALIQDYLGHRNIQHAVRYTATNAARFERLWR